MDEPFRQKLRSRLSAIEPDYAFLASYGDEAMPILQELVAGDDQRLAERALVLAARIGSERSLELVREAAFSPHESLRAVAAARSLSLPAADRKRCLEALLRDQAPSVRRLAVRTVGESLDPDLTLLVAVVAEEDPEDLVRRTAESVLGRRRS